MSLKPVRSNLNMIPQRLPSSTLEAKYNSRERRDYVENMIESIGKTAFGSSDLFKIKLNSISTDNVGFTEAEIFLNDEAEEYDADLTDLLETEYYKNKPLWRRTNPNQRDWELDFSSQIKEKIKLYYHPHHKNMVVITDFKIPNEISSDDIQRLYESDGHGDKREYEKLMESPYIRINIGVGGVYNSNTLKKALKQLYNLKYNILYSLGVFGDKIINVPNMKEKKYKDLDDLKIFYDMKRYVTVRELTEWYIQNVLKNRNLHTPERKTYKSLWYISNLENIEVG